MLQEQGPTSCSSHSPCWGTPWDRRAGPQPHWELDLHLRQEDRKAGWAERKRVFRGQLQPKAKTGYSKCWQRKLDYPYKPAVQQKQEDRQGQFVPKETRVRWSMLDVVLSGDCQLSAPFDKDQNAESSQAVATTHLAVLRDLHLLPLRHLSNVEMTLWDPQRKKTTRSIRRKSKPEETKHTFWNFCS